MSDLVSRQAAIDAVGNMLRRKFGIGGDLAKITLAGLPSAQPALDEWCTDCKEYDQERHCCPRWNRVIRTALDDARKELSHAQPEIIRCKDCKYWREYGYVNGKFLPFLPRCGFNDIYMREDDFCSKAERKEKNVENS